MSETAILAALSRLEAGQGRMETRLDKLETRLDNLETWLDKLETSFEKLEAKVLGVASSQTTLRVDIMARMDRLENSLTDIRNDIVVNIGAANHIRTMHDNTREEVRLIGDHVARMFSQIKGIQTRLRDITGEP